MAKFYQHSSGFDKRTHIPSFNIDPPADPSCLYFSCLTFEFHHLCTGLYLSLHFSTQSYHTSKLPAYHNVYLSPLSEHQLRWTHLVSIDMTKSCHQSISP